MAIKLSVLPLLLFLVSACVAPDRPTALAATDIEAPGAVTAEADAPPSTPLPTAVTTATPQSIHTPSPAPTQAPTISPSSTRLPQITLFVPESWIEQAATAVDQLNDSAVWRTWRLADDPQADVRLVNDASGAIVGETALALAVPFTLDWESVGYEEAVQIMAQGHESVTVIPWPELRPDQKALRVDGLGPADSAYLLRDTWSLTAAASLEDAVEDLMPLLQEAQADEVIHLAAVGDIMLDRSLGYNLQQGNLIYPFVDVAGRLQEADVTVGNVESALGDLGEPELKRYPFRAPPEAAESLALAGFDIVSLANNHGMDYGEVALLQALDLLRQQGVMPIGAGAGSAEARAPEIVEANGLTTAFFGYVNVPVEASTGFDTASWTAAQNSAGLAWADPQTVAADISAVHNEVDLIVVLLHSGFEYQELPSEPQMEAARAAIDAGANLVIGHHAHILQGIEQYGNGVIIYGTGNFAFDIDGPPETAIFHIWLDGNGVREIAVEPAIVQFGGQPRIAADWEAPAIRSRVYRLSDRLNRP